MDSKTVIIFLALLVPPLSSPAATIDVYTGADDWAAGPPAVPLLQVTETTACSVSQYPAGMGASASASTGGSLASSVVDAGGSNDGLILDSRAYWSETYVNSSGSNADYYYNFTVTGIDLRIASNPYHFSDEPRANYSIQVLLNGSAIWSSSVDLTGGATLVPNGPLVSDAQLEFSGTRLAGSLTQEGNDLEGPYVFSANYNIPRYDKSLSLGNFSPGSTFTLEQILTTGYDSGCESPDGHVIVGDPLNPGSSPGVYGSVTTAPVPEPSMILLLGSGLAGLAGYGRKRLKKQNSGP